MSLGIPPSNGSKPSPQTPDERLRKTASQLEGVFVQRLFAAMRETVPEGGIIDRSGAESTFTDLLDQKVSEQVPGQWSGHHSIAEALYHQLRQRLQGGNAAPGATKTP